MKPFYYRRARLAAALWFISLAALIVLLSVPALEEGHGLGESPVAILTISAHGLSFFLACIYFAKAKGYSGFLGMFCAMFYVFGLGLLLGLEDRG